MHKQMVLLCGVLLLTGCGTKSVPKGQSNGESKDPPRAELRIGDGADESRHLSFRITGVHEHQKPSPDAPYHIEGGEWTFLDCQASSDPNVVFTVGMASKSSDGQASSHWGKAVLIVKDRGAGARFVELFSKAFSGKLPTPVNQAHVPKPLSINTAILGANMDRGSEGGFSGTAGAWTATKWFPELDGESGEVYFNFNLAKRKGELSEKDAEYADALAAIFASALRDGPRPERTPENDPNLTRTGPTIGKPQKLLSRLAAHYSFSPKGRFAVYQDRSTIWALPLDGPDTRPCEMIRFEDSPWEVRVLDDDLDLIVQEGISEVRGMRSSGDPMRVWWVDGKTKAKKLLQGPEKDLGLAEVPVSPDHRYVALHQWKTNPRGKGRTKFLQILNRESGEVKACESQGKNFYLIGWRKTDAGLRVVAVTNRWQFEKKEVSELYLVDPATGKVELQDNVDARLEIDNPLSPDGKHRIRVGKDELIVTDTERGEQRRFVFHVDDRRFVGPECVEWVAPRYLKFNGPRLALIDVTTMKMCFPASADGARFGSHTYKFSPGFRWVLFQGQGSDEEGLFLSPLHDRTQNPATGEPGHFPGW
jgi:hypothetical protein